MEEEAVSQGMGDKQPRGCTPTEPLLRPWKLTLGFQISKSTTKLVIIFLQRRQEAEQDIPEFLSFLVFATERWAERPAVSSMGTSLPCWTVHLHSAVLLCICPEPLLQDNGNSFFFPQGQEI